MRLLAGFLVLASAWGNDTVFLSGQVKLKDGGRPPKSAEIKLDCKGADHAIRQTVADKKGKYHLKVERDEFNHVARALPTTAVDLSSDISPAVCSVIAVLPGYTSSSFALAGLDIGKNLTVPDLVLTPAAPNR